MVLRPWETSRMSDQPESDTKPEPARDYRASQATYWRLEGSNTVTSLQEPNGHARSQEILQSTPYNPDWGTSSQTSRWITQQQEMKPRTSLAPDDAPQEPPTEQHKRHSQAHNDDSSVDTRSPKRARYSQLPTGNFQLHYQTTAYPMPSSPGSGHTFNRHSIGSIDSEDLMSRTHQQTRNLAVSPSTEMRCNKCFNGKGLMHEAVENLTKLAASLTSGAWAEVLTQARRDSLPHEAFPKVAEMHKLLGVLAETNQLAKQIDQYPLGSLTIYERGDVTNRMSISEAGPSSESKRSSISSGPYDATNRQPQRAPDHQRIAHISSVCSAPNAGNSSELHFMEPKRLPPIRPHSPSSLSSDVYGNRLPSMHPPPAPSRHMPSPPPSYNLPSPTPTSYAQSSITSHPHSPPSFAQPTIPLSPAIAAHTASLQHTVSHQTFALSTLQSEHNKLLSALSRSKTRTAAIEEKASVSEREVCELAEERDGLLGRVRELEEESASLRREREEERVGRVRERGQYVEMLRLGVLLDGNSRKKPTSSAAGPSMPTSSPTHTSMTASGQGSTAPLTSAAQLQPGMAGFVAAPLEIDVLRDEVRKLRKRCADLEGILRTVQEEQRREDEAARAASKARARLMVELEGTLNNTPQ